MVCVAHFWNHLQKKQKCQTNEIDKVDSDYKTNKVNETDSNHKADKAHKPDSDHKINQVYKPNSHQKADKTLKPDNNHKAETDEVGSSKADSSNLSASLLLFGQKC